MWLRVLLVTSFGMLAVALFSTSVMRLSASGPGAVAVAEVTGALLAVALVVPSMLMSCSVRVTREGVTVSFWILFRATVATPDIVEFRADEWNSWDFGGYGLEGGRKRGWLLNATADGTGAGDMGILLRSTNGRSYRVEVREPQRFVERATVILGERQT